MTLALDTNAYSAFLSGDRHVLEEMAKASVVYLPLFVIGELHFGFRGGDRVDANIELLSRFLDKPTVRTLLPSHLTAEIYGEIKDTLKRAGTPIPVSDVWIGAACIETASKLITYDTHFKAIPGLRLWRRL